jgi:hypothetical protein
MPQNVSSPPHRDLSKATAEREFFHNLVAVSSEPTEVRRGSPDAPLSFRVRPERSEPILVRYSRLGADDVVASLTRLYRREGRTVGVYQVTTGALAKAPRGLSSMPEGPSAVRSLLGKEQDRGLDKEAIARAIVTLRAADALVAGPLSGNHANIPGFLAHLADLARRAYRALRPPPEIIAHPGFSQIARRFDFLQMSHQDARVLAGGAVDISVLAQCLRQRHGPQGEFAITRFRGQGILWADQRAWEIDPIGVENADENALAAAFCTGWVVARRFLGASAPKALAYARTTATRVADNAAKQ